MKTVPLQITSFGDVAWKVDVPADEYIHLLARFNGSSERSAQRFISALSKVPEQGNEISSVSFWKTIAGLTLIEITLMAAVADKFQIMASKTFGCFATQLSVNAQP